MKKPKKHKHSEMPLIGVLWDLFKAKSVLADQYDLLGTLESQRASDPELNAIIHEARIKNRQVYHNIRGLYKMEVSRLLEIRCTTDEKERTFGNKKEGKKSEKETEDSIPDLGGC